MDKKRAIAIFLAVIMVGSIVPMFFSGSSNNKSNSNGAPTIDSMPGEHVEYQLNSIADGLAMSPEGITSSQYVNYTKMHQSQLKAFVPNETQLATLYNAKMTKEFIAVDSNAPYESDIVFRAHEIDPQVVYFNYTALNEPYNGYYFLARSEDYYNVVGSPMLFGSKNRLEDVIDVLSGTSISSHDFDYLLSKADPGAEFQMISSENKLVADQYYLDFKALNDGGYSRTSLFLNLNQSVLADINALAQNSSKSGLQYTITKDANVTKVVVTANESNFFNLALEPST